MVHAHVSADLAIVQSIEIHALAVDLGDTVVEIVARFLRCRRCRSLPGMARFSEIGRVERKADIAGDVVPDIISFAWPTWIASRPIVSKRLPAKTPRWLRCEV